MTSTMTDVEYREAAIAELGLMLVREVGIKAVGHTGVGSHTFRITTSRPHGFVERDFVKLVLPDPDNADETLLVQVNRVDEGSSLELDSKHPALLRPSLPAGALAARPKPNYHLMNAVHNQLQQRYTALEQCIIFDPDDRELRAIRKAWRDALGTVPYSIL